MIRVAGEVVGALQGAASGLSSLGGAAVGAAESALGCPWRVVGGGAPRARRALVGAAGTALVAPATASGDPG